MTTSFQSLLSEMNAAIARADQIILEWTELLNMLNKKENTMNDYDRIKIQLARKVGKQKHTCITCEKEATAKLTRVKYTKDIYVITICLHCHTSYSFLWKAGA